MRARRLRRLHLQQSLSTARPPSPRTTPVSQGHPVEVVLVNGRRLVVPVDVAPETLARLLPVVDGPMIAFPAGVRVWIAGGVTDMRRGMNTLALQVQEGLGRDPHAGEIFCFRGRKGDLIKLIWHDGVGMSLYTKRLEAGKFIWPISRSGDAVQISAAQMGYLLEGIDWRNPRWTQRPAKAG